MSKMEAIKQNYDKDVEEQGHKPKYGFFSIPPNATAGSTAFKQKQIVKDQNGRVKTKQRGIYPGLIASGTLKKSYFKYENSVFQGEPFMDPGKHQRIARHQQQKKLMDKDVYKPLSLTRTPSPTAAYEYICDKPTKRLVKDVRDQNGRVFTEERNIYTNPQTKVQSESKRAYKYVHDPYQNFKVVNRKDQIAEIQKRGEVSFKSSSPMKQLFSKSKQMFFNTISHSAKRERKIFNASSEHDAVFKPSCVKKYDHFSYPAYQPSGPKQSSTKKESHKTGDGGEKFKPVKNPFRHRPSPSIANFRINVLRSIR